MVSSTWFALVDRLASHPSLSPKRLPSRFFLHLVGRRLATFLSVRGRGQSALWKCSHGRQENSQNYLDRIGSSDSHVVLQPWLLRNLEDIRREHHLIAGGCRGRLLLSCDQYAEFVQRCEADKF